MENSKINGLNKIFLEVKEDNTLNNEEKENYVNELKELEKKLLEKGNESDQDFSEVYNMSFITFWEGSNENKRYQEYKNLFSERLVESTDPRSKIELEINNLDIHNLSMFNESSFSIEEKEPWIGELIAVNGENPSIFELIFESEKYNFLSGNLKLYGWNTTTNNNNYSKYFITINRSEIFSKLERVCYGFTEEKKHEFLRSFQNDSNPMLNSDNTIILPVIEPKFMTQRMAWLHELEILKLIMEKTKKDGTYNYSKAAKVICSIIECADPKKDLATIRNILMGIFSQNESSKKNNPFKTQRIQDYLQIKKNEFGLE